MPKWKKDVREITYEELGPLQRALKREHLSARKTQNTIWFGLFFDGELVGCYALIWTRQDHTTARLKSGYVDPAWRKLGGYRLMMAHGCEYAFSDGADYVEGIARYPRVLQSFGWEHVPGRRNEIMRCYAPGKSPKEVSGVGEPDVSE